MPASSARPISASLLLLPCSPIRAGGHLRPQRHGELAAGAGVQAQALLDHPAGDLGAQERLARVVHVGAAAQVGEGGVERRREVAGPGPEVRLVDHVGGGAVLGRDGDHVDVRDLEPAAAAAAPDRARPQRRDQLVDVGGRAQPRRAEVALGVQRTGLVRAHYICSGADTPSRSRPRASTVRVASLTHSRVRCRSVISSSALSRPHAALVVPLVVLAGELLEVAGDPVRLAQLGRLADHPRELAEGRQQHRLGLVVQQRRVEPVLAPHAVLGRQPGHPADPGVRVLHVEHGVVVAALAQLLAVQVERRVRRVAGQGVPDGVAADPVDQVTHLDHVPGALGQLGAVEVDQLADQHLDVDARVVPGAGGDGLEPADVAVVVRAEHVDLLGEAPVLLAQVVRGVRGEVGGHAVLPDHHPVPVVAEVGRAQPHRAVGVEDVPLLAQPGHGLLDRAALVQGALAEPDVEVHVERGEHLLDLGQLGLVAERRGRRPAPRRRAASSRSGRCSSTTFARPVDVLAGVAVLRDRLAARPRQHGRREVLHLGAGVVDVVLAGHLAPLAASSRRSESPSAAQRVCPMCSGPVGFADTNSRFTTCPASVVFSP